MLPKYTLLSASFALLLVSNYSLSRSNFDRDHQTQSTNTNERVYEISEVKGVFNCKENEFTQLEDKKVYKINDLDTELVSICKKEDRFLASISGVVKESFWPFINDDLAIEESRYLGDAPPVKNSRVRTHISRHLD